MTYKITFNSGSGSIQPDSLSEFSYSESVPPLEPSDSSGGISQITLAAGLVDELKNPVSNKFVNSRLLINNDLTVTDAVNGSIAATINKVSIAGGLVSITANTAVGRMNKVVSAPPVHGSMLDAITEYCSLVSIVPTFETGLDDDMDGIDVNFPAWNGNLWDNMKLFCSSVTVNGKNIEVISTTEGMHFRLAVNDGTIKLNDRLSDYTSSIDSFDAARSIALPITRTWYGVDKPVYEAANYDPTTPVRDRFRASITDSMQVEAGATVTKRFQINATLTSVKQPVCVATITRTPPAPYEGTTGEYVVVGSDNLPIKPAQWIGLGGSLSVSLTETPGEIEITVTAPPLSELERESGGNGLAPYSIGIESSGDGEYPALWIVGTGVFYYTENRSIPTGAGGDDSKESASGTDSLFLTTDDEFWTKAALAAQRACGPSIELSIITPDAIPFGTGVGSVIERDWNRFRINSANYGPVEVSMTATPCATFSNFNDVNTASDFADFTLLAGDYAEVADQAMQFNEFTIVPLMKG